MTIEAWIRCMTLIGMVASGLAVLTVSYCIYTWFRHEPWKARNALKEQKEKDKLEKEHPTETRMVVNVTIPTDTTKKITQLLPDISLSEDWRPAAKPINAGE